MNVVLLSIGNEILAGDTVNTNASWISKKLTELGCSIKTQMTVPDEKNSIQVALKSNLKNNPALVITTGGLGPTEDDITREVIFDFVGTGYEFDEDYWKNLKRRFERFGFDIPESNRSQALIPTQGKVIPNSVGSARGLQFQIASTTLITLPGVPAEMKAMMTDSVIPMIQENELNPKCIRTLRTTGIPESALIEKIAPVIEKDHACDIGYYPSLFGVDIRISHIDSQPVGLLSKDLYKILEFSMPPH